MSASRSGCRCRRRRTASARSPTPPWRARSAPSRSSAAATRATSRWSAFGGNGGVHALDLARAARHPPRGGAAAVGRVQRGRHAGLRPRAHRAEDRQRSRSTADASPTSKRCKAELRKRGRARGSPPTATQATRGASSGRPTCATRARPPSSPCRSTARTSSRWPRALRRRICQDLRLSRRQPDRAGEAARGRPRPARAAARLRQHADRSRGPARRPTGTRPVSFARGEAAVAVEIVDRGALGASPRPGPLIIEEFDATIVVPPDASVHRDAIGSIVLEFETA